MADEWQIQRGKEARKAKTAHKAPPDAGKPQRKQASAALRSQEVCAHFQQGFCAFGDKCYKRHDGARQAAPANAKYMPPLVSKSDPRYKTQLCIFNQQGLCGRGSECSFAHSREELLPPARSRHQSRAAHDSFSDSGQSVRTAADGSPQSKLRPPSAASSHSGIAAANLPASSDVSVLSQPSSGLDAEPVCHDIDPVCCPITQEVMASPVLMSDGFSYERSAITAWLSRSDRSPMTTEPLSKDIMIPNHTLKALIAHATAKV